MDAQNTETQLTEMLKKTLSRDGLNELGIQTIQSQRLRVVTSFRLLVCMLSFSVFMHQFSLASLWHRFDRWVVSLPLAGGVEL